MANHEVIIVGAGSAGLAAASALTASGIANLILEASSRTGGRVHTVSTPRSPLAIELGAEFIHGMPPTTLQLVRKVRAPIMEGSGRRFQLTNGKLKEFKDFWDWMEKVSSGLSKGRGKKKAPADQTWFEVLEQSRFRKHPLRPFAMAFLEGFHGADPMQISYASLVHAEKYSKKIQSEKSFRLPGGYAQLVDGLSSNVGGIRLQHQVRSIRWRPQEVTLQVETPSGPKTFEAKRVVICVPLPILKTGIEFSPALPKAKPLSLILMGQVSRVTFEFDEPFWQGKERENSPLADIGFLLAPGLDFGTWWSTSPVRTCRLVGWAGYDSTLSFQNLNREAVIDRAIGSLAKMTRTPKKEVEARVLESHCRLWHSDPFTQGAYSYYKVGAGNAMKELAEPVEKTLYFAGEHCHYQGNHASVDGAIETGFAAAKKIREHRV